MKFFFFCINPPIVRRKILIVKSLVRQW